MLAVLTILPDKADADSLPTAARPCVIGASRATVDKTCSARDRIYQVRIDAMAWN